MSLVKRGARRVLSKLGSRCEGAAYERKAYSQEGEDLILARIFEGKRDGFFVDVGAFHPIRFSNTYYFYLQGWRGINIDAMPGSMAAFNEVRPEDINLEVPVSVTEQTLTYYAFNEPALNGFSKQLAAERDGLRDYKVLFTIELKTSRLDQILDKYLPSHKVIDFLTVDAEGFDYEVLTSNNWDRYKPTIVLVEDMQFPSLDTTTPSKIISFMESNSYRLYCKTVNTLIFQLKDHA